MVLTLIPPIQQRLLGTSGATGCRLRPSLVRWKLASRWPCNTRSPPINRTKKISSPNWYRFRPIPNFSEWKKHFFSFFLKESCWKYYGNTGDPSNFPITSDERRTMMDRLISILKSSHPHEDNSDLVDTVDTFLQSKIETADQWTLNVCVCVFCWPSKYKIDNSCFWH